MPRKNNAVEPAAPPVLPSMTDEAKQAKRLARAKKRLRNAIAKMKRKERGALLEWLDAYGADSVARDEMVGMIVAFPLPKRLVRMSEDKVQ